MTLEGSGGHVSFNDLNMLADFYAPELRVNAAKIRSAYDVMFSAVNASFERVLLARQDSDVLRRCDSGA